MAHSDVESAARILRDGGLVAFPTETVYGLGADATNERAVDRIFEVKGRPRGHPLIVHLAAAERLDDWAREIPEAARVLAGRFWPGPLTLVLRRSPRVAEAVTGGLDTVGLRVPDHPLTLAMLACFGGGVAAPSANRFGSVSPTTAQHVREDLGEEVDLILDGGACRVGIESTIVDLTSGDPAILRPGGVTRESIEAVLARDVGGRAGGGVRAPGQMPSHYAPRAEVRIVSPQDVVAEASAEAARGRRVGMLVTGESPGSPEGVDVLRLGADTEQAAHDLYATLREADRRGLEVVVTALPPQEGIGSAIADRLRKAAGSVPAIEGPHGP